MVLCAILEMRKPLVKELGGGRATVLSTNSLTLEFMSFKTVSVCFSVSVPLLYFLLFSQCPLLCSPFCQQSHTLGCIGQIPLSPRTFPEFPQPVIFSSLFWTLVCLSFFWPFVLHYGDLCASFTFLTRL